MYTELFQSIGLSLNEAKVYETLLELGRSSVSDIALRANIHRRNVYDTVNRLVEKGLLSCIVTSQEHKYAAVNPVKLLEIVGEKKIAVEKVLPKLKKLYKDKYLEEDVSIYKGIEGYKNLFRDILEVGENIYAVGIKSAWADEQISSFMDEFWIEAKKKKIKLNTLVDDKAKEEFKKLIKGREKFWQYKILPKQYDSQATIDIYGDRIATVVIKSVGRFDERITVIITKNKLLAESYRQWFQFIWDKC
ncbi:MAG: helix-turn-helix domain-containing protein [Candidatus Paceibacterota bacterium]|jgi:sugar-specific transcriptional regulator TrmB